MGWGVHVLGLCQADLVLRSPPHLWSADRATAPSRPVQLSGWIRELAGRVVCCQEGVVLQGAWERLPKPGRWVRDFLGAIRLRCRLRQLDGRLVCAQEGLVLCKQGQRLSTGSRRLCMMFSSCMAMALAFLPSSGAIDLQAVTEPGHDDSSTGDCAIFGCCEHVPRFAVGHDQ